MSRARSVAKTLKNIKGEAPPPGMNPEFMQIIERARTEFAAGQTLTLDEMKREVLDR